jgi:hypothetical protein
MELFAGMDLSTAERIAWGALGLLSFILLFVWLRWEGPWEDQKKDEPPKVPKGNERKAENDNQSVGSAAVWWASTRGSAVTI